MECPRLRDYDVKVLIILGNQTNDREYREEIRKIIVSKMYDVNYSLLYLLNAFLHADGILRDVYADLLIISMYNNNFILPDNVLNEVIKLTMMDTLTKYGMESSNLELKEKCKNEFWNRALEEEDKIELIMKKNIDNPVKLEKLLILKKER